MAISNNSSYIPTCDEFFAHWGLSNTALGATPLIIRLPDNTTMTRAQFGLLRDALLAQQMTVQSKLIDAQIARGTIELEKEALLANFNGFTGYVEAYYQKTVFIHARPLAPVLENGQERFTSPLVDAMSLWEKINAAPAPAGVTLPVTLANGMTQGTFASAVSSLQFAYQTGRNADQNVDLARANRNALQERAYTAMKTYRLAVPVKLAAHPALVETLPRLTPEPGHTPQAVNASAVFEAPNLSKVVYTASEDPTLYVYQLRGTVGNEYSDDDAVVIAVHGPAAAREFVTDFGLTQPGAKIALKVFVVLTTGNESGSATMLVQRPALSVPLAA